MQTNVDLASLPTWVLAIGVVWAVAELALAVIALIVLVRTPAERTTLPKWAWAIVVVAIQMIGPIAFLAAGRRPAAVDHRTPETGEPSASPVTRAVDLLYNSPKDSPNE